MSDSIKKITLRNGKTRYRTVVDAGRDENGKRVQLTITRDTKTEVKEERARILHQKSARTLVLPSKITVAEWLDEWLRMKARDIEATSIHGYRKSLIHIYSILGHVRLQELTEDMVRDCVDHMVSRGRRSGGKPGTRLAVSTVQHTIDRFRQALARAVTRKLITENPAKYVRVSLEDKKTDRRERRRVRPWNVAEVQTFVKGIEDDRLHAPLLLSLMGLRPAEVCGLRWSDVDLTLGTLETAITRTMVANKTVIEKDTKTEAGERVLPLPQVVWEALRKFKARQAAEKLAAGEAYTDSGLVVVDELGVPVNTRQLREQHAYRLMASLGLRKVRLYDARHSCLTYLANNGVLDHILAAWAGHTNVSFTKKKYVHPDVEDLRAAAEVWDGFHGGALSS
ncbi:tyrosine recombinase XerC [Streptomyces anandii]|uniref:tyrosine recombinase XerC n=1 Tax=Streptomyces anandii TaxID=285454 RepID=UPI0037A90326